MFGASYGAYHARDWSAARTDAEIRDETARCRERGWHGWRWNEVGNATINNARIDTLNAILAERKEGPHA